MTAGTNNYLPYNHDLKSGNCNILYFGGLGENFEFKFQAEFILNAGTAEQPIDVYYTLNSNDIVSKSSFEDGVDTVELSYNKGEDTEMIVTLTIAKVGVSILNYIEA